MPQKIIPITLGLPLKMGSVNCYLVRTGDGFVLVDTGAAKNRTDLERALKNAGCEPGNLKLIIITHGDFDHIGNAAHLRGEFGGSIAMHADDSGMAERGDMFWNRKSGNALLRTLTPLFYSFNKSNRFRPDILLEDGQDLFNYGWDARVIGLPGHSKGSIGILTADGNLLVGDLLENVKSPGINAIMDDLETAVFSLEKLKGHAVKRIYPGHGEPFGIEDLG
jgi:hydroxyacylglutathione hydrolase